MTMTKRLQARGWSDQLISFARVMVAVMTLGGIGIGGLTVFNTIYSIPNRLATVEAQAVAQGHKQSVLEWYIEFLVRTECARLAAETKAVIRNGGGVDCDQPGIKIPRNP